MLIICGVSQRSTLRPLLFLLDINDLNYVFNKAITTHFDDDTHLSYTSKKLITVESVMNLNSGKSKLVVFCSKTKKEPDEITINVSKSKLS